MPNPIPPKPFGSLRAPASYCGPANELPRRGVGNHLLLLGLALLLAALLLPSAALATGDANQSSCPFETESSPGFRSFLPDCRAYELVTPAYGGGSPAFEVEEIAPEGEQVLIQSGGGFAGIANLELQGTALDSHYELSRTTAGWTAEALDPPVSLFPRREFIFPSTDLSRVLFKVVPPNGDQEFFERAGYEGWDLAAREPGDGGAPRFVLLGPMLAPGHECEPCENDEGQAAVAGASSDLSRVFLAVAAEHRQLWPGDETVEGGQSVYEYRLAEGKEPVLVGVSNSGVLAGSPHVNDGAALVSECGTAFDAVSASGEAVVFTALAANKGPGKDACNEAGEGYGPSVNELYVRLSGSRTVDISEPSSAECTACETSSRREAVYQGASEDGSEVFFTSEQELLPGANGNALYEYDAEASEGQRVSLLASDVASVQVVSRDGSHVYFTSLAHLTAQANANGETAKEVPGEKLYVSDTKPGALSFVAGEPTQEPSRLEKQYRAQATANGNFLVFASLRDLLGTNDTSTVPQLFEYDAQTGLVSRVSAAQKSSTGYECPATETIEAGYDCDGNTTNPAEEPFLAKSTYRTEHTLGNLLGEATAPGEATHLPSVAENGTVVFRSPLALTPQATQGRIYQFESASVTGENVYEYRGEEVYLISPADEAAPQRETLYSRLAGIDESGKDVFLFTTDSLVPQDTNTEGDIYDAREDGGFPAPAIVSSCAGEACQGPTAAPPTFAQGPTLSNAGVSPSAAPPTSGPGISKVKSANVVRTERLARSLKVCRKKPRRARVTCERHARAKYAAVKAKRARSGGI